jgi:uncharacterized protein (DUF2461 family)
LPSAWQAGDPLLENRLRQLVASLPPKWRAMVILRYQEDLEPVVREHINRTSRVPHSETTQESRI